MTAAFRAFTRSSLPPFGFARPNLRSDVDVAAAISRVPRDATGKGMFLARLMSELDRRGIARPTQDRFLAFRDYPLAQCLEVNAAAARLMFPFVPLSEGLRRVAWTSFDTFASSLIGNVLFGAVGRDVESILRLASRAVGLATNVGSCHLEVVRDSTAVMTFDHNYLFAEPFGTGMLEGVLRSCECEGEVLVRMDSPIRGAFHVRW
jgi:uncharacterized protein (TIGR02265 family)